MVYADVYLLVSQNETVITVIQGFYALKITAECRMNSSMNVNYVDLLAKNRMFYEIFWK